MSSVLTDGSIPCSVSMAVTSSPKPVATARDDLISESRADAKPCDLEPWTHT